MRVEVAPRRVDVVPGIPVSVSVSIFNAGLVIASHSIHVLGVDARWVEIDRPELALFPDEQAVAQVAIALPSGIPAGVRRVTIQVRELTAPFETQSIDVDLAVAARQDTRLELSPVSVTAGSRAEVSLSVANLGNDELDLRFAGEDEELKVRFEFEPPELVLAADEERTIRVLLAGSRPWFGSPKVRPFTVRALDDSTAVQAAGAFIQRPRLSRGLLGLLGLLTAMTVFASVLTFTVGRVVDSSSVNRELLLRTIRAGFASEGTGTGTVAGSVTLRTGANATIGVAGVTVQVYSAKDLSTPVSTTATSEDGTYLLENLGAGSFKLRYQSAGFATIWYPDASDGDGAKAIELDPGQSVEGIDIKLGGVPAEVSGTVIAETPIAAAGATVTVEIPQADAATQAATGGGVPPGTVVARATTDASGAFDLAKIPSPRSYELVVAKAGYATERQLIDLAAGEVRGGLKVQLRKGDGSIRGVVSSASGPVGGATITATDGTSTFSTVSLSTGAVGSFLLPTLPTPGTYSLVVADPDYATATVSLGLSPAQQVSGVEVVLVPGAGSIAGTLTETVDGEVVPAGEVTVTVSDGKTTRETASLSANGDYYVGGLALPATYTVTLARADLQSQSRSVTLDPSRPDAGKVEGLDIELLSATASLHGIVTQTELTCDPSPCAGDTQAQAKGEVTVTLTKGSDSFQTLSQTGPTRGLYRFDDLAPGTYSLTFTAVGAASTNQLVTLQAGDDKEANGTVSAPAEIEGVVKLLDASDQPTSSPASGVQVTLYTAAEYPFSPLDFVVTDASGNYHFTGFPAPGIYVVAFANPPNSLPQASTSARTIKPGYRVTFPVQYVSGA